MKFYAIVKSINNQRRIGMTIDTINRDELQYMISQLEQALYNHQQWYSSIIRSLVCRLPPDKHDISENAHRECRFGQWYYDTAAEKLRMHPGFIALGVEHLELHKITSKLLLTINTGGVVLPHDYDTFANTLEKMRLELFVLQRELSELFYNRDALTGAINRINMLSILREQQELVKRNVHSCSIAMMDFDYFKEVNDQYGHTAGDYILAGVSRYILEKIRPYDRFFRVGGEEFLICFQNANIRLAYELVERLRTGIQELNINISDEKAIGMTVSFGISAIKGDLTVEKAIENADKALYKAKQAGRNQTMVDGDGRGVSGGMILNN